MLLSFILFFILFTGVGLAAYFHRKEAVDDYLLASRATPGWLVALSMGSTTSSGATFIGFAGFAYFAGIAAVYAAVGILVGEYIAWRIAKDKIRKASANKKLNTYPELITGFGGHNMKYVKFFTALLSVFLLGAYCSAQLVAGAKVGAHLFDTSFEAFVWLGALLLIGYCWAGGIRASIWSDAVQAVLMIVALLVLITASLIELGGMTNAFNKLQALGANDLNPFQPHLLLVLVGWVGFGFSILGQPHVMVRHMVAKSASELKKARNIALSWRFSSLFLASVAGLLARILIPATGTFDAELSMPALWETLLPPALVGLLLAGLFAATLSTADSLLLSASSALTQNLFPKFGKSYTFARLGTLVVMAIAVSVALLSTKGVLSLVILVWGGMASALTPLLTIQLLGAKPSQKTALTMMVAGLGAMLFWRYGLGLHKELLDLVPGMAAGFAVYGMSKLMRYFPGR